ncbi:MAG: DegT/DnrJ/EryC1/StrS family aminotransferase, partial [Candidatus Hydrogenedentes bacterium]|nr:DegT/DnrJ/EryC1/StrS family aminotransferase [Candidatus Hydrogenedentota bacterium]
MSFPKSGIPKETLFETLKSMKANDLPWKSGKVLAYTYDPGEETSRVVQEAYLSFLTENALDPTTFPSTQRLEVEIVHILRDLLRGDDEVVGNCTFGGTESIMCAVKTARDWARANRPEIDEPEMLLSKTAHAAFHKAAAYLGIKVVMVSFDPVTFEANVEEMRAAITPNTILIVGSAPGYAHGV